MAESAEGSIRGAPVPGHLPAAPPPAHPPAAPPTASPAAVPHRLVAPPAAWTPPAVYGTPPPGAAANGTWTPGAVPGAARPQHRWSWGAGAVFCLALFAPFWALLGIGMMSAGSSSSSYSDYGSSSSSGSGWAVFIGLGFLAGAVSQILAGFGLMGQSEKFVRTTSLVALCTSELGKVLIFGLGSVGSLSAGNQLGDLGSGVTTTFGVAAGISLYLGIAFVAMACVAAFGTRIRTP